MNKEALDISRQYLNYLDPKMESSSVTDRKHGNCSHDVSIIIPCYNSEKYIEDCLYSVLGNKGRYDIQVIAIDDGSTDSTGNLLNKYSADSRVTVIHQENKGFSGARNTGLDNADAKYVFFLDSDDIIFQGALDVLIEEAEKTDADIIEGKMISFGIDGIPVSQHTDKTESIRIEKKDVEGYMCGKLFKSALFDNICFPQGYWYEDGILPYLILPRAERIYRNCVPTYAYRSNPEGITSKSQGNPKSIDAYWLREVFFSDMDKLGIKIDRFIYEQLIDEIALTFVRTSELGENVNVAIFYLTAEWFADLNLRFTSENRFHSILEKALSAGDYDSYKKGCEIAWNGKLVGLNKR